MSTCARISVVAGPRQLRRIIAPALLSLFAFVQRNADLRPTQERLVSLLRSQVGLLQHDVVERHRSPQVRRSALVEIAFLKRGGRVEEFRRRIWDIRSLRNIDDPLQRLLGSDCVPDRRPADAEREIGFELMGRVHPDAQCLLQMGHRSARESRRSRSVCCIDLRKSVIPSR